MSTIVLRSVKGSPLTNDEVDQNFSNLNADKLEATTTATLSNKTISFASNTLTGVQPELGYTPLNSAGGTITGPLNVDARQASNIVAVPALDIDCSAGNYFTKAISGNSTFTFSNAPAARAYGFTLELTHASGAVTWPTAVQWPGGIAPTLTAGKTSLLMFVTDDGGTRWRGAALVDYTN